MSDTPDPTPQVAAGEPQRLIVAEDAEVVIEHYLEDWLAFAIFWGLAFIVFLQFFTRYVLNDSLSWTEEIARYGLMWIVFIGGAMVTRRNTHIAVELLSNVMKPGPLRSNGQRPLMPAHCVARGNPPRLNGFRRPLMRFRLATRDGIVTPSNPSWLAAMDGV